MTNYTVKEDFFNNLLIDYAGTKSFFNSESS